MSWFEDLRYALRQLRTSPGFTIAAVLTLALAIGANAVVFSIMNAFIIRPLNVPKAEKLFGVWRMPPDNMAESYPDYLDLRDRNHSFEALVAYNITLAGLDAGTEPSRSWIEETTGNYFDGLGIQPYLGRLFHASDERGPNSAPYIVLTHAFWHTHFHDDRGVLGRVVQVNKHPFTIIGVAPPDFHGTLLFFHPDFFVPLVNAGQIDGNSLIARGDRWIFMTMGYLKPGVTVAQAISDLNSIGADLEKNYPKEDGKTTFKLARPSLYGDFAGGPIRKFLTGLLLLSGLILLAACANLGSLFAARATDRSREIALRLALGSSRKRVLRSLFTQALLISILGGILGLLASLQLLTALSAWQPFARWPVHLSVNPDARVYGVALLLTLVSGFLFGAVPVRQVLRTDPYHVLKMGSTGVVRRYFSARDSLLVIQIAICAVLVTSSVVAVRGLARSLHSDFGFAPQNTLLADTDLGMAGYRGDQVAPMQKRMIDALGAIPGVESVGLTDAIPLGDTAPDSNVFRDNASDLRPSNAVADPVMFKISPEYLRAAGTALRAGRNFNWHDDMSSPRVAVVNPAFARKLFGSEEKAIGAYYKMPDGARVQVVGIAESGKYASLTEDPTPAMFLPILQWPTSSTWLVVRSSRDPQQLTTDIRNSVRQLDEGVPLYVQTRLKELNFAFFGPRMATLSLGVLGLMGAMLAVTGVFGMAAYSVSKRMKELGIRIALGGRRKEVLRAALGGALRLLAIGSVAGLLLGILASRVLAYIVYQATPRDPLVLAAVVFAMALLGLMATWIPAQRALSVDPMVLLRDE